MSSKLDKSLDDLITSERKPGGGSRGRRGRGGSRGGRGGGRRQSNGESNGNYSNPLSRGDESEGDSTGPVRRERRQPRSDGPYNGRRDGDADGQWNHDRFDQRASRPSGLASSSTPAVVVGGTRLEAGTKVLVTNLDPSVGAEDIKEIFQNLGSVVKAVVFYDSERRSLGSAEVTFGNIVTATRAVEEYDGAEVDGRPMTLKLLSGVAPPPKNVVTKRRERVTQPTTAAPRREREQSYGSTREDRRDREDRGERPARRPRGASAGGRGARRGGSRGGRGGRGGRDRSDKGPAPTNDSLDKELESYQASRGGATPAAATTATPAAATGQPE